MVREHSSIGRTSVSKTEGCGFNSYCSHMQKIQVKPIEDMIQDYPKIKKQYSNKEIQVIVITKEKYEYSFKPLIHLKFDDITKQDLLEIKSKEHFTFISEEHVDSIYKKLPEIKNADVVFVCCDAGISRSPAVASAIAHHIGDAESYANITWKYPFANNDVFHAVLIGLRNQEVLNIETA